MYIFSHVLGNGSRVLIRRADGSESNRLSEDEVRSFVKASITRRHRNRGYDERFFGTLNDEGSAFYVYETSRDFPALGTRSRLRFTVSVTMVQGGYKVSCGGHLADWNLERVNYAAGFLLRPPGATHKKCARLHTVSRARIERRKRERDEARRVQKEVEAELAAKRTKERKERRAANRARATLTLEGNETERSVVRQFRHNQVLWREAIRAVQYIFEVKRDWKLEARQIVARELHDSLERSGGAFARFKRGDFEVRFILVNDRWCGDLTTLEIAATKGADEWRDASPGATDEETSSGEGYLAKRRYRRMRTFFNRLLKGKAEKEQRARRILLAHANDNYLALAA